MTTATTESQERFLKTLDFSDTSDFEDAKKGLVEAFSDVIRDAEGKVVWDMKSYAFENNAQAPATVNPSLWRQERLNNIAGLFKVSEHIYQVRGLDLSNMTIIEGKSGLIIVDPLISSETAAAAMALYRKHFGNRPVVAVIYSHSHVDHYGGVKGVVSEADVYAGTAMSRRAQYMYGALLPKSPTGQVGAGLGKTTSRGTVGLIAPTDSIGAGGKAVEQVTIDGLQIEFQLTPGTEAPAEMNMYIPAYRALGAAENATHTLHNVLTIRGAQVRDPSVWSSYLDDTIARYGATTEVLFAQHHWPTWGTARISAMLADQRDMYRYINDQTLRLINLGYTPMEIAEELKTLPPALGKKWYNRDYYGSMSHNVRAVYQRYMGFYDGNPANLNPLPPVEAARKYVASMGGEDKVIALGRTSFAQGDYRWVAELMKHVVFANPQSAAGKALLAETLDQMGFQSENGTWRNAMLMGAFELRNGVPKGAGGTASPDTIKAMPLAMYFDYLGIRLNGPKAAASGDLKLNWVFSDPAETHVVTVRGGALTHRQADASPDATATLSLSRKTLDAITLGQTSFDRAIGDGSIKISGDRSAVTRLFSNLDTFPIFFNIVTP